VAQAWLPLSAGLCIRKKRGEIGSACGGSTHPIDLVFVSVYRYTMYLQVGGKRLPRVDYKSLAEFRYEIRRFLNLSEMAARRSGLEPQQHQALLAIKGHSPGVEMAVGRLAERLQVRHHMAVELTDRVDPRVGFDVRVATATHAK
jgi:hypothetical protein